MEALGQNSDEPHVAQLRHAADRSAGATADSPRFLAPRRRRRRRRSNLQPRNYRSEGTGQPRAQVYGGSNGPPWPPSLARLRRAP
eukprot:5060198-Prymnesium_polylepis.1